MRGIRAAVAVVGLAAAAGATGVALAGKPSGGGSTGGGTIYYFDATSVWSMASDGSAKTQLPAGVTGDPSSLVHGGHRWFLRPLTTSGTNPDGTAHTEMFALRDDGGASVQLTSAANLEFARPTLRGADYAVVGGSARWAKNDAFVSVAAVDWTGGPSAPTSALFVISLSFDGSGTPSASSGAVAVPGVATSYVNGASQRQPAIDQHDWSPDGATVAWTERQGVSGGNICTARVTSVGSGAGQTVATDRAVTSWSSTGVLLLEASDGSVIESVPAAGGTRTTLVALENHHEFNDRVDWLSSGAWSPTASHFAYVGNDTNLWFVDVFRETSAGSGKTNLTNSTVPNAGAYQTTWR